MSCNCNATMSVSAKKIGDTYHETITCHKCGTEWHDEFVMENKK
jgi:hypothetical protein